MSNLYQEARKRQKELQKLECALQARLAKAPPGKIHVFMNGKYVMYYLRNSSSERTGTYISVRDEPKIRTYLQKSYDEKLLKLVQRELSRLDPLLSEEKDGRAQIQDLYSSFPEKARKFLKPADIPDDTYVRLWLAKPYQAKEIPATSSSFISLNGDRVRSKSELNIANALFHYKIPYKYECPLTLSGGITIYPDFTILNGKLRKVLYWEHRGMMDDRDYATQAVERIKEYEKYGIFPGDNLIITEETLRHPLGTEEIKYVIRHYLLS